MAKKACCTTKFSGMIILRAQTSTTPLVIIMQQLCAPRTNRITVFLRKRCRTSKSKSAAHQNQQNYFFHDDLFPHLILVAESNFWPSDTYRQIFSRLLLCLLSVWILWPLVICACLLDFVKYDPAASALTRISSSPEATFFRRPKRLSILLSSRTPASLLMSPPLKSTSSCLLFFALQR